MNISDGFFLKERKCFIVIYIIKYKNYASAKKILDEIGFQSFMMYLIFWYFFHIIC